MKRLQQAGEHHRIPKSPVPSALELLRVPYLALDLVIGEAGDMATSMVGKEVPVKADPDAVPATRAEWDGRRLVGHREKDAPIERERSALRHLADDHRRRAMWNDLLRDLDGLTIVLHEGLRPVLMRLQPLQLRFEAHALDTRIRVGGPVLHHELPLEGAVQPGRCCRP